MTRLFPQDLDHVLTCTAGLWDRLRGGRLFVTGGTGFFGCWLLETFAHANATLGLKAQAVVLTRNPDAFRRRQPHLADNPAVRLLAGDVRTFDPPAGPFDFVIHAATETWQRESNCGLTSASSVEPRIADCGFKNNDPQTIDTLDTIVTGTRRVLDAAAGWGAKGFLFTSSGAIYGVQPPDIATMPEEFNPQPVPARRDNPQSHPAPNQTDPAAVYGNAKRAAEALCSVYAAAGRVPATIARCFAFVGPHLPLDAHFAVGNFIRDGLAGGPITVAGDGSAVRSYLYAADLAAWLWTMLFRGQPGRPYNVGSEAAVTIAELARLVVRAFSPPPVVRMLKQPTPGGAGSRYVPSVRRAAGELGLTVRIGLAEAIERTVRWCRQ